MAQGTTAPSDKKKVQWLPLESNPDVMNKFIAHLGVINMAFCDVFGLDAELLAMVPSPCCAIILLFPVSEKYQNYRKEEAEKLAKEPQIISPNVFYLKQTIGNACGTVALIHCLANSVGDQLQMKSGAMTSFIEKTKGMTPQQRGEFLETFDEISVAHKAAGEEGQTAPPLLGEKVDLHFVAFIHKDGQLYELDGRKDRPITHGGTTKENFLSDVAKICQLFMQRDPEEHRFTIIALASNESS